MRRRTVLVAIGMVFLVLGIATTSVVVILKHIPKYYDELVLAESIERRELSGECVSRMSDLLNDIENAEPKWGVEFTGEQLNSFFQQDFLNSIGGEHYLPEGFSDPRIVIDNDKLKIGIRYGVGFWSAVVTLEVRVWLVADEVNMIALEIQNLKAGGMSISPNVLLDYISETARSANMTVTWYRHQSNPVAILRYQADQLVPSLILQRLECVDGKLAIAGQSTEGPAMRTVSKPIGK